MFSAWFQARLIDAEFGKNVANLSNQFAARASRPFKFRTPVNFSSARTHETLPVVSMRICNPDRSPFRNRRLRPSPNSQPALLRLSAITSQVFHAARFCRSITGKP